MGILYFRLLSLLELLIMVILYRFTHAEARKQLPAWVKPYVKVYEEFGQCVKDIIGFFKFAEKTVTLYNKIVTCIDMTVFFK